MLFGDLAHPAWTAWLHSDDNHPALSHTCRADPDSKLTATELHTTPFLSTYHISLSERAYRARCMFDHTQKSI